MTHVSDIKLIRTDTTLDLSQKAEKGMIYNSAVDYLLLLACANVFGVCPVRDLIKMRQI
uniref:Uncharacterized protein n=1 Tax=Cajanus cajan TaxID=3821 RepID=A0A151TTP8_CAJCA|nr:hypothetical protein KK1_009645 [Cajanus cajan]